MKRFGSRLRTPLLAVCLVASAAASVGAAPFDFPPTFRAGDIGPIVSAPGLDKRVFASARAAEPVVNEVDLRDREAYLAQRDAEDVDLGEFEGSGDDVGTFPDDEIPAGVLGEYVVASIEHWNAEVRLDEARDVAWDAVPSSSVSAMLIDEPLQLAMLEMHIEVRRRVGANAHTVVPGLEDDPGCAGDLISERLLYTYGSALVQPFSEDGAAVAAELERIARQVVCVSDVQLEGIELALLDAFARVRDDLFAHGRDALVPILVRALAPVQVLVLDARKHLGEGSSSWRWFVDNAATLGSTISTVGWATGELMLWDRREGMLIGFTSCASDGLDPLCIDLGAFLDSLGDPRALGLGDCALAGMLSRGRDSLPGGPRYTCPLNPCASPVGKKQLLDARAGANDRWTETTKRWASLGKGARTDMESICQGGDLGARQGMPNVGDRCVNVEFNRAKSPFENYTGCMVDALKSPIGLRGNPLPSADGELRGVPTGSECAFAKGGKKKTPKGGKKKRKPAKKPKKKKKKKKKKLAQTPLVTPAKPKEAGSTGVRSKDGKVTVSFDTDDDGTVRVNWDGTKGSYRRIRNLMNRSGNSTTPDGSRALFQIWQRGGRGDCAEGAACDHSCSSVGKQLSAVRACSEKLLEDAARALGRPDRKNLTRRLDWVSRPTGDEPVKSKKGFGLCGDRLGPRRQPTECGLILCSDASLAAVAGSGCTCGQGHIIGLPKNSLCLKMRCADGNMPAADCTCRDHDGKVTGVSPKPGPLPTLDAAGYTDGKFTDVNRLGGDDFGLGPVELGGS